LVVWSPSSWTAAGAAAALRAMPPPEGIDIQVEAIVAWHELPAGVPLLWLHGIAPDADQARQLAGRPLAVLRPDAGPERMRVAVAALAQGLDVHDPGVLPAAARGEATDDLRDPLTPRELEVFELLAQGLPNHDIAQRLGISPHTAKFHVAQILEKTGTSRRTEAVRLGLRLGLVGL
jgi:DNA-binding NarL/FixJ family response regulator